MFRSLVWSSVFVAALALQALAGEPFRFAATPGRLPKNVVPSAYRIYFEPSVETGRVTRSETITIDVREATRTITLNCTGLAIASAKLSSPVHPEENLVIELFDSAELLTLTAAAPLPPGRYELQLSWRGELTERPQGLFLTRYQTAHGERRALATQMEATDARRMFPCWDEPVFRATFQLTVVVPAKWMALSNMPVASESAAAQEMREVAFAPTPPMASYLVAFAAGEFEVLEDEAEGVKLRVVTTEGKKEQGRYALEATKQILAYYNDYFGTRYPLPKLDQFCFPGLPAGGMENWGAIFYNDTALLVDPAASSQASRERVFEVVAHEIAHQWFGDLVTMAWWDDLWLNEGFASWMGTKATDHFHPEWEVWLRAASSKEYAMQRDARRSTHPIQQPVQTEAQAGDAFDEITYQKGQAFLRMLEAYLGESGSRDSFRDGIRRYLTTHAYSSATTADLWSALEAATHEPVRQIARGWTEQPGFPLIHFDRVQKDGRSGLRIWQERFTIHQPHAAPLTWLTPFSFQPQLSVRAGEKPLPQIDIPLLVELIGPQPVERPCDESQAYSGNAHGTGYFRVAYDEQTFSLLAQWAGLLRVEERMTILADTWALVQADRLPAARACELLKTLARTEQSFAVWHEMLGALQYADRLQSGLPGRATYRAWARQLIAPEWARLGWEPHEGEPELRKGLRAEVIGALGEWGDSEVLAEAGRRFARYAEDPQSLAPDLRSTVLTLAGLHADAATYDRLHDLARRETSTELKRQLYQALASNRAPELAEKTLDLALTDELIPNDATALVGRVATSGEQPALAWAFAQKHFEALLGKLASIRANDYLPGLARSFMSDADADALEAFAKAHLPPGAQASVEKAADDIRFKADFQRRLLPQLTTWLAEQKEHDAPPAAH